MKVSFGAFVITAGICGILSFAFLATSLGTDYWYIIEMNPVNISDFENLSSHSGLWSINEGRLLLSLNFASKCLRSKLTDELFLISSLLPDVFVSRC